MIKIELVRDNWTKENIVEFKNFLIDISEEKYRDFNKNLIPNCDIILGIRLPKLREIAKNICKGNYIGFLNNMDDEYYETTMLQGLVTASCKVDYEERKKLLYNFVPKINNWAVCDATCSTLKCVAKNRESYIKLIKKYLKSKNEFEIRFAVILLMSYYITDEYIDMVLDVLKGIDNNAYYVKMGVAWALSVCFVKYEDKTMNVLLSGILDKDTLRKSFQKIIESNRVDKETKNRIRDIKKEMC